MKIMLKKHITQFFRIIVCMAVIGMAFQACKSNDPTDEKTVSGVVTANTEGTVLFMYSRSNNQVPDFCKFTTDLPSPNNQFTLTISSGSTVTKEITGLTAGQKVSWTITVKGNPLNHGSGNFVHIIND